MAKYLCSLCKGPPNIIQSVEIGLNKKVMHMRDSPAAEYNFLTSVMTYFNKI